MQAMIFDLDGTLLDTLADIGEACNHALAANGFAIHPFDDYRQMVGNGFEILVKRALGQQEVPPEEFAALVAAARRWYGDHLSVHTMPYAGMPQALKTCSDAGVFLGVLSNKPDEYTVELVEEFFPEIPFGFVLGARVGHALKPDAAELLHELGVFKLPLAETCYVGDSDVDVLTAKNAGVSSIGAGWGFRGMKELQKAGCGVILENPSQLCELLTK